MAEPFKNLINPAVVTATADHIKRVWPAFDRDGFLKFALRGLNKLELKERMGRVQDGLVAFLPDDGPRAIQILCDALDPEENADNPDLTWDITDAGIAGWMVMPMSTYVADLSRNHFEDAIAALRLMTMRSSSEFAIRTPLIEQEKRTLKVLKKWARDPNHHVRRLVSEGTRGRLPWGQNIPSFIADPAPVLPLLEALKDDPSEYVRRSVANNLNGISKDHPDLVADLAKAWLKSASKDRKRLVRHACRTLIKAGHTKTLSALGYGKADVRVLSFTVLTPVVSYGDALEFHLELASNAARTQPVIIDYVIHHMKANGKTSPKTFKWKDVALPSNKPVSARKRHPIKPITTRRYYPGGHRVDITVNGDVVAEGVFDLKM